MVLDAITAVVILLQRLVFARLTQGGTIDQFWRSHPVGGSLAWDRPDQDSLGGTSDE